MSKATGYKYLRSLMIRPERVCRVDVGSCNWIADHGLVINASAAGVGYDALPAEGQWWRLRASAPAVPADNQGPLITPEILSEKLARTIENDNEPEWQQLTVSRWALAVAVEDGFRGRLLVREDKAPVLMPDDLLGRYITAFGDALVLEHRASQHEHERFGPIRVSRRSSYTSRNGRHEYNTVLGAIMPLRTPSPSIPLPEFPEIRTGVET